LDTTLSRDSSQTGLPDFSWYNKTGKNIPNYYKIY
jgi:hypothetical protein